MKDLGKIIFYLLATVVLGTLLAAPLYWGGQWLAAKGILVFLGHTAFRKFFHRGLLIAAIALLWPTAAWIRVTNVEDLRLEPNSRFWRDAFVGFLASFLMMVALGGVLLALGIVQWETHIPWTKLGKVAITAAVVPLLEEGLFRGAILGLLLRAMPAGSALFATSALFSILHFLKPTGTPPAIPTVGWLSGFALIPESFSRFSEPWLVLGGFTTLFCVGWILGSARIKTESLAVSIGLHSGWILGIMGFSKVTHRIITNTLPWFGDDLSVGLGSVAVVCITGAVVGFWIKHVRPSPDDGRLHRTSKLFR